MAFIVLDTETAPFVHYKDGNPHPETSGVYDLGYIVVDNEEIVYERSFVITDVFYKTNLMESAYYADKLPQYYNGLKTGEWEPVSFLTAWRTFKADVSEYNVKDVWAYNCLFDVKALNSTLKTLSNDYAHYFLPFKTNLRDVWDYASNITGTTKYLRFCEEQGLFTNNGNPKTSAEAVYRFITGKHDFEECHTALKDAKIEYEILKAAKKKHKKTRHSSKGQGWCDAAKAYKKMQMMS